MNPLELDQLLNQSVFCTLAPSPVHGVGVFAIRDIPKGQKMSCQELSRPQILRMLPKELEKLRPEIKKLILQRWPIVTTTGYFQSPNHDVFLLAFINHSDTPNYDKINDTALRDIKMGEEIFEHYGEFVDIIKL
mgnify:FL=1